MKFNPLYDTFLTGVQLLILLYLSLWSKLEVLAISVSVMHPQ